MSGRPKAEEKKKKWEMVQERGSFIGVRHN